MKCGSERAAASALAAWFRGHARDLPFRKTRDPYRIWVSEVMLQQTRVAAMLPAYERFIDRFPDACSLAAAPEEEVLQMWQGLGYYSRARNLHRAASIVSASGAVFPHEFDSLLALPGIGSYTAAAVASISADEAVAVVDGNVVRVLSRLCYSSACSGAPGEEGQGGRAVFRKSPGKAEGQGADSLPRMADTFLKRGAQSPSVHNQAIMELGALVCVPGRPKCEICPLQEYCAVFAEGGQDLAETIPPSTKEKSIPLDLEVQFHVAPGLHDEEDRILLIQNTNGLFLKGQMFFPHRVIRDGQEIQHSPGYDGRRRLPENSPGIRHSIMRWRIQARGMRILRSSTVPPQSEGRWMGREEAARVVVSSLGLKLLDLLQVLPHPDRA